MLAIDPEHSESVESAWLFVAPSEAAGMRKLRSRIMEALSEGNAVRLIFREKDGVDRILTIVLTDLDTDGMQEERRSKLGELVGMISDSTKVDTQAVCHLVSGLPTAEIAPSDKET